MDFSAVLDSFQGDSPVLQFIGKWGYKVYAERELIEMNIHMIISALFPIYAGAHASLRCPTSAESPKRSLKNSANEEEDDDDDDDEIELQSKVEGLTPSDAILFPVMGSVTLAVLYCIIKWAQDPALLNKILTWYFSGIGIFGVGKLAADALNLATTFIFPSVWSSNGQTYFISPLLRSQLTGSTQKARVQLTRKFVDKTNPFPGFLSSIPFPTSINEKLWTLRALLKQHWIFRGYLHGVLESKSKLRMNDMIGLIIGVAAITAYNMNGKAWWLANLMGFGSCYAAFQLMSPTTFWTGSLVLSGLFIYDIVMVFYTPMMITVATSLEVPMKLVFPGRGRGSMLGLGDIILPGIMMALALRFDLYLHYLAKQTKSTRAIPQFPTTANQSNLPSQSAIIKAPYVDATERWGDRFWTWGAKDNETNVADGARFKKIYFKASLIGYTVGLIVTIVVMNVFQHGQPALLYLVPGVLISLWGTALVRGEAKLMWEYSEDSSINDGSGEKENENTDQKNQSPSILEGSRRTTSTDSLADISMRGSNTSVGGDSPKEVRKDHEKKDEHAQHVFLFSLTAPRKKGGPKKALLFDHPPQKIPSVGSQDYGQDGGPPMFRFTGKGSAADSKNSR